VEILSELLVNRRIPRSAVKDSETGGYNLLLVDGDTLDYERRMLGEKVAPRLRLVGVIARHREPDESKQADTQRCDTSGYPADQFRSAVNHRIC
jgi:hypothetical protein